MSFGFQGVVNLASNLLKSTSPEHSIDGIFKVHSNGDKGEDASGNDLVHVFIFAQSANVSTTIFVKDAILAFCLSASAEPRGSFVFVGARVGTQPYYLHLQNSNRAGF